MPALVGLRVDDVQKGGLLPVLLERRVPKTASPHDDVHRQIPIGREGFSVPNLVRNPKSLQRAGDRVEERLVLVHLRPGSGAGACVSGVHVDCVAAGAPHCHVFIQPP